MGEEEFELISREEIERLRAGAQAPPQPVEAEPLLAQGAITLDDATLTSLNATIDKLNGSFSRLFMLFDKAQKDLAEEKPDNTLEKYARLESQNEKIASGMVAIANMIRDQQIQINQLSLIMKGMQERMDEIRLQRRPTAAFKIAPQLREQETAFTPTPDAETRQTESHQIEIDIPRSPQREIIEEEKHENYQTLSMFSTMPPPPPPPERTAPTPPVTIGNDPIPEKKNILAILEKMKTTTIFASHVHARDDLSLSYDLLRIPPINISYAKKIEALQAQLQPFEEDDLAARLYKRIKGTPRELDFKEEVYSTIPSLHEKRLAQIAYLKRQIILNELLSELAWTDENLHKIQEIQDLDPKARQLFTERILALKKRIEEKMAEDPTSPLP